MSKPPRVVKVVWKDTFSLDDVWHAAEDDFSPQLRLIHTVGYVISESDDYLAVASTWDSGSKAYSNAICILKCCIISRSDC